MSAVSKDLSQPRCPLALYATIGLRQLQQNQQSHLIVLKQPRSSLSVCVSVYAPLTCAARSDGIHWLGSLHFSSMTHIIAIVQAQHHRLVPHIDCCGKPNGIALADPNWIGLPA